MSMVLARVNPALATEGQDQGADQARESEEDQAAALEELEISQDELPQPVRGPGVASFADLKMAIENAPDNLETTIEISGDIELTERLVIAANKIIKLVSRDEYPKVANLPGHEDSRIELPALGGTEAASRQALERAKQKGEAALLATDLEVNPLPKKIGGGGSIEYPLLKRGNTNKNTLFKVESGGQLIIGRDKADPLFIDGNSEILTELKASFIQVEGKLVLNGGFIANGYNRSGYSAPIQVMEGGHFDMNGGRITNNKNIAYIRNPNGSWAGEYFAAGAVYLNEGGRFNFNAGSIDNNKAPVGGVFLGNFSFSDKSRAEFTMNGGIIVRNTILPDEGKGYMENYGGGVHVDSNASFTFTNGIIAGNKSYRGGGIAISDNYIEDSDPGYTTNKKYGSYDDYVKVGGAVYKQAGGLVYKNIAVVKERLQNFTGAGGGLYINSSTTSFEAGLILENESENMGGGIYVSIVPYELRITDTLITENEAIKGNYYGYPAGEGGGYWNCPTGIIDFADFNSLYIFNNKAAALGGDIRTLRKDALYIDMSDVSGNFHTRISPVTKGENIIKYEINGKRAPEKMYYTNESIYLEAIYDEIARKEAWTSSKVFIMGNKALKGGGIGSNAHIFAPGKPGEYEIVIEKYWDSNIPAAEIPESIWVDLFIGDKKYGEIELSKDNNWRASFKNLPFTKAELEKRGLKYSIEERDNFYSLVTESMEYGHDLEIKRVWLDQIAPNDPEAEYDAKPRNLHDAEKVIFICKDESGREISREAVKIANKAQDMTKDWTGTVKVKLPKQTTNEKLAVKYHSFDKEYHEGFPGLDNGSDYFGEGPEHELYLVLKEDGTVEIQVPYLWTQYMANPDGSNSDYLKNNSGYRVDLKAASHKLTLTNYPYSEIPVIKKWLDVPEDKRPGSIKVYLLKNQQRVKDSAGQDRYLVLTADNGWQGKFDKLPYFALPGMDISNYSLEEEGQDFDYQVRQGEVNLLDLAITRKEGIEGYPVYEDYTGGTTNIKSIPVELRYEGRTYKSEIRKTPENAFLIFDLKAFFNDLPIETDQEPKLEVYYKQDGQPWPRNLGQWQTVNGELIENPGSYVFELVKAEEGGGLVLRVPKLTGSESQANLFAITMTIKKGSGYLELTNSLKNIPPEPTEPTEPTSPTTPTTPPDPTEPPGPTIPPRPSVPVTGEGGAVGSTIGRLAMILALLLLLVRKELWSS